MLRLRDPLSVTQTIILMLSHFYILPHFYQLIIISFNSWLAMCVYKYGIKYLMCHIILMCRHYVKIPYRSKEIYKLIWHKNNKKK